MSSKAKKNIGKIEMAILVRTLIPMLLMGMVIVFSAVNIYEGSLRKEVENTLAGVAVSVIDSYENMYPGDYVLSGDQLVSIYKGEHLLNGDNSFIDDIKKATGVDISICYGNTRINTTLKDENANRYDTTGVNAAVYTAVSNSESPVFYEVDIDGEKYYACYAPVFNSDHSFVGIVATAKTIENVKKTASSTGWPIWIISIISMGVAALISFSYSKPLAAAIDKIENFLSGMTKGDLSNEMPSIVTKRDDELGRAGKAVVDMQNAIRILVERDPLTGLYNRRYGNAKLRKTMKQSENSGVPFAICMGDIDFFKKVNDTYGHEAGDVVLKRVTEIMKKHMVGKGFVARWGGEEFLLVFSRTDAEGGEKELWEILEKIRKMEILYDGLMIKVTMTFGVVDGGISTDYAALLREADSRLYYGKLNGRNRVVSKDESGLVQDADKKDKSAETSKESEVKKTEVVEKAPEAEKEQREEVKRETIEEPKIPDASQTPESLYVIDDAFLNQLVEKMSEKLFKETMESESDED